MKIRLLYRLRRYMLRETLYFLCISLVQAACPTPEIDYSTNYAYNGDFELPVLASNYIYRIGSNAILDGWKTKSMELGKGFIYNPRWGNTQVIELDTTYNENYTKTIEVQSPCQVFFQFDYAARSGRALNSSGVRIWWNREIIQSLPALDYEIHTYSAFLQAHQGINQLGIEGTGISDGTGTSCDNIKVYPLVDFHRTPADGDNSSCPCNSGYFDNYANLSCIPCNSIDELCQICDFSLKNSADSSPSDQLVNYTTNCTNESAYSNCSSSNSSTNCTCSYQVNCRNISALFNQSNCSCENLTFFYNSTEINNCIEYCSVSRLCSQIYNTSNSSHPISGSFQCQQCASNSVYSPEKKKCEIQKQCLKCEYYTEYANCNSAVVKMRLPYSTEDWESLKIVSVSTDRDDLLKVLSAKKTGPEAQVDVVLQYRADLTTAVVGLDIKFTENKKISKQISFTGGPVPNVLYTENQCEAEIHNKDLLKAVVIISYAILFISMLSGRIIGLQLFEVLQIAYFSLSQHTFVNIYLSPILQWNYVNGYNYHPASNPFTSELPQQIFAIGFQSNFISNINVMLVLLFADFIIGAIMFAVSKLLQNEKLQKISRILLQPVFITLVMFNTLNISFSLGVHLKYSNPSANNLYGLEISAIVISISMLITSILMLTFANNKHFGEFKSKFKRDCISKSYISYWIIYRFLLGMYMATNTEWEESTLIILGFSLTNFLINIIHLPFNETLHNYRSILCQFTELLILGVANYYTNMKYFDPLSIKAKIFSPAFLIIALLLVCMVVSFCCLVKQICSAFSKWYTTRRKVKFIEFTRKEGNRSQVNFTEENCQEFH